MNAGRIKIALSIGFGEEDTTVSAVTLLVEINSVSGRPATIAMKTSGGSMCAAAFFKRFGVCRLAGLPPYH
jgi:hypothetical protein